MPIYQYGCDACGSFTAMHPVARFQEPQPCPGCGYPAPRTISGATAIGGRFSAGISGGTTAQMEANAPRASAAHPAGCGCCMRRMKLPGALSVGGRVFTSHGPIGRGGQ